MSSVFVSSLPFRADEELIRDLFKPFGVGSVRLYADWINPTFEPYAEVEVKNAAEAVDKRDGKKVENTFIRVHTRS